MYEEANPTWQNYWINIICLKHNIIKLQIEVALLKMVQLQNLSRHRAFTLVETIIALNLICWLIIITSIDLRQQWHIQQEKIIFTQIPK